MLEEILANFEKTRVNEYRPDFDKHVWVEEIEIENDVISSIKMNVDYLRIEMGKVVVGVVDKLDHVSLEICVT